MKYWGWEGILLRKPTGLTSEGGHGDMSSSVCPYWLITGICFYFSPCLSSIKLKERKKYKGFQKFSNGISFHKTLVILQNKYLTSGKLFVTDAGSWSFWLPLGRCHSLFPSSYLVCHAVLCMLFTIAAVVVASVNTTWQMLMMARQKNKSANLMAISWLTLPIKFKNDNLQGGVLGALVKWSAGSQRFNSWQFSSFSKWCKTTCRHCR